MPLSKSWLIWPLILSNSASSACSCSTTPLFFNSALIALSSLSYLSVIVANSFLLEKDSIEPNNFLETSTKSCNSVFLAIKSSTDEDKFIALPRFLLVCLLILFIFVSSLTSPCGTFFCISLDGSFWSLVDLTLTKSVPVLIPWIVSGVCEIKDINVPIINCSARFSSFINVFKSFSLKYVKFFAKALPIPLSISSAPSPVAFSPLSANIPSVLFDILSVNFFITKSSSPPSPTFKLNCLPKPPNNDSEKPSASPDKAP